MAKLVSYGDFDSVGDTSMGVAIRQSGSEAQKAVDDRIAPVAAGIIATDGTVKAAAAAAVDDALTDANVAMRSDVGMPKSAATEAYWEVVDAIGGRTFLAARKTDGAPTSWATSLIATALIEAGYTFGGGGGSASPVAGPIVALGDSLTEAENWTTELAAATSLTVRDVGIAGQSSTEVAFRSGALTVGLTVTGNSIPASGSVAVTALSPNGTWRTGVTVPWSEPGTLAGVPGVLYHQYSGNSGWSFVRDVPGSAVSCPAGTPFIVGSGDKTGRGFDRCPAIIWVGRNNVSDLGAIQRDIAAMVAKFTNPKTLILSVTNMTTEPSGSAGYTQVMAVNNWIASTYPSRYVDVRRWLIDDALREMGLTATTADTTAISEDRIPPQLLSDSTHMTPATSTALGKYLGRVYREKGL